MLPKALDIADTMKRKPHSMSRRLASTSVTVTLVVDVPSAVKLPDAVVTVDCAGDGVVAATATAALVPGCFDPDLIPEGPPLGYETDEETCQNGHDDDFELP